MVIIGSLASIAAATILSLVVVGGMYFSYNNSEVKLRNLIEAKQTDNGSELDNMMKKITQIAEVTNEGQKAIREFVVGNSQVRANGQGKGTLFAMVTEAVPDVNPTSNLFINLMNTITSSRDAWTMRQKELVNMKASHDNILDTYPSRFFVVTLGGKDEIEIQIVTSTRANDAMESGVDDEVKLFN